GHGHLLHAVLVEKPAEAAKLDLEQAGKGEVEQVDLALAQNPHQKSGFELAGSGQFLDQLLCAVGGGGLLGRRPPAWEPRRWRPSRSVASDKAVSTGLAVI